MNISPVKFDKEKHTYHIGDRQLQGITGLIGRHLFKDKYSDIPKEILDRAAEYGTLVHDELEDFINSGEMGISNEFTVFFKTYYPKIKGKTLYAEYLVSDEKHFATKIDLVELDGESVELTDYKTTYALDKDYLSWQLSICAYLFELQTGVKVTKLKALHLRGDICEEHEIPRKSDKEVKKLLQAEIDGVEYCPQQLVLAENEIALIQSLETFLSLKETEKRVKELIKEKMLEQGLYKVKVGDFEFTYCEPTTRQSLDSKTLKKEMPDVYEQYTISSAVADSVRIKWRGAKDDCQDN